MARQRRLRHLHREEVVYEGPAARKAFERARKQVMDFTVYDRSLVAVDLPPEGLTPGLEFVQRLRVGPFGLLRLKGPVRVLAVWDRRTPTGAEAGFTYRALPGHPEVGEATFAVALAGQRVLFRIESDSAPGRWFTRLGAPVSRLVQKRAYGQAFARMRERMEPVGTG